MRVRVAFHLNQPQISSRTTRVRPAWLIQFSDLISRRASRRSAYSVSPRGIERKTLARMTNAVGVCNCRTSQRCQISDVFGGASLSPAASFQRCIPNGGLVLRRFPPNIGIQFSLWRSGDLVSYLVGSSLSALSRGVWTISSVVENRGREMALTCLAVNGSSRSFCRSLYHPIRRSKPIDKERSILITHQCRKPSTILDSF